MNRHRHRVSQRGSEPERERKPGAAKVDWERQTERKRCPCDSNLFKASTAPTNPPKAAKSLKLEAPAETCLTLRPWDPK